MEEEEGDKCSFIVGITVKFFPLHRLMSTDNWVLANIYIEHVISLTVVITAK